jgi:hypothetical protein
MEIILKGNKKAKGEVEFWKGEFRRVLAENKKLKKEIELLQKYGDSPEKKVEKKVTGCPNCETGELFTIYTPGDKIIKRCKDCGYRN